MARTIIVCRNCAEILQIFVEVRSGASAIRCQVRNGVPVPRAGTDEEGLSLKYRGRRRRRAIDYFPG
jgi:hypothetical protein